MIQEDTKGAIPIIISETNGKDVLSFLGGGLVQQCIKIQVFSFAINEEFA